MQIVQQNSEVKCWVYATVISLFIFVIYSYIYIFKLEAALYFKTDYQLILFHCVCEGYFA